MKKAKILTKIRSEILFLKKSSSGNMRQHIFKENYEKGNSSRI